MSINAELRDKFIPGISDVIDSTGIPAMPQTQELYPTIENQGTYEKLNKLFESENTQQRQVQEAREVLGDSAKELTDDQVFDLVNNVQFLVEIWEEEFEKTTFGGKTLNELLGISKI